MKRMFPAVREAMATLIDPSPLRQVAFSHDEPDERGSPFRGDGARALFDMAGVMKDLLG